VRRLLKNVVLAVVAVTVAVRRLLKNVLVVVVRISSEETVKEDFAQLD